MRLITLVFLGMILAGCATIFTGTSDEITFNSNVDPVKVYVDGLYVGDTPLKVPVDRQIGEGRLVQFKKDGYATQEFHLRNKFNWISISDVSSIIVSGGVDVLTGAIMQYSPTQYHIEMLQEKVSTSADAEKKIRFASFVLTHADDIKLDLASGSGTTLDTLTKFANEGVSSFKFVKWITDNTQELLATKDAEHLLTVLRSSGMTP